MMDLMNDSMAIIYGGAEAWENGKGAHVAKCREWLLQLSDYLGDRQYICGNILHNN